MFDLGKDVGTLIKMEDVFRQIVDEVRRRTNPQSVSKVFSF